MKPLFHPIKLTCALIFALVSFSSSPVLSEKDKDDPGGDDGAPTQQGSTGKRGNCNTAQNNGGVTLTALVPKEKIYGGTKNPRTTLWFHVDQGSNSPQSNLKAELMILNEGDTNFLEKPITIELPKASGFIAITLPPTETSLYFEKNKWYNWHFTILCDAKAPANDPSIPGWVRRVDSTYLPNSTGEKYWYDKVDELARRRCKDPTNSATKNEWDSLLKAENLEKLIEKPMDCTQL